MFEDYVPETELERAFVQSLGWEMKRLWRETRRSLFAGEWMPTCAYALSLGYRYGEKNLIKHQFDVIQSIVSMSPKLDLNQQYGLYKLCIQLVEEMIANYDVDLNDLTQFMLVENQRIRPYLIVMINVLMTKGQRKFLRMEAKSRVVKLIGRPFTHKELRFLGKEALVLRQSSLSIDSLLLRANANRTDLNEILGQGSLNWNPHDPTVRKNPELSKSLGEVGDILAEKQKKGQSSPKITGDAGEREGSLNWEDDSSRSTPLKTDHKYLRLMEELDEAKEEFGESSRAAATALIRVTDYVHESQLQPVDRFVNQLLVVLRDDSIELSEFQLRKIYAISGRIQGSQNLVEAAEELQHLVFIRRERLFGLDLSTGVPLSRLLTLWQSLNTLHEGEAFFQWIMTKISTELDQNNIVRRQIESAYRRFTWLQRSDSTQAPSAPLQASLYEDHDEFITMLSVVAFDHMRANSKMKSEHALMEMLAYYSDCESDIARRVGEMLWLLMETELRFNKKFRKRLIELSIVKAFDQHLRRRCGLHVLRLLQLCPDDPENIIDLIDITVKGAFDLEETDAFSFKSFIDEYQGRHTKLQMTLEEICAQVSEDDEDQSTQMKQLQEIEKLVRAQSLTQASDRLSRLMLLLPTHGMLHRLLLIAKLFLDANRPEESEKALNLLVSHMTKFYIPSVSELVERLGDVYLKRGDYDSAIRVFKSILDLPIQSKDDVNRFLIRLAYASAMADEVFDATAVTYLAFSDIPEPYEDRESDTEPLLLKPEK